MATLDAQRVRELLHGDAFMFTSGIGGTGVVGVSANGSGPAVLLLARALTPIGGLTMRIRKHPLTPLAAVTVGLLAGAVGTVCLDAVHYLKYRRAGSTGSPLAWEFAPVDSWETAPDPGQAARRVIEGFTRRKLADQWAWPVSTAAHWAYGSAAAAGYGVLAGSSRTANPAYGLPFGAAVWITGYVVLPEAGLLRRSGSTTRRPWPGT